MVGLTANDQSDLNGYQLRALFINIDGEKRDDLIFSY